MSANRKSIWGVWLAVLLTPFVASITAGAQQSSQDFAEQLRLIQQNIETIDSRIADQGRKLQNLEKAPAKQFEAMEAQVVQLNHAIGGVLENQSKEREISFLRPLSQIAPIVSACVAVIAASVAYVAYRRTKINAAAAHMHGVFKDYLKLRFDHHQKLLEKGVDYAKSTASVSLNNSGETLAHQLAGIQLYALEEIFFWLKERKKLNPASKKEKDVQNAWRSTIASHLTQYPADIAASIDIFAECYSVEFLEYVSSILNIPEVTSIVKEHRMAISQGNTRPGGFAIKSYLPPSYHRKQSNPVAPPPT